MTIVASDLKCEIIRRGYNFDWERNFFPGFAKLAVLAIGLVKKDLFLLNCIEIEKLPFQGVSRRVSTVHEIVV